MHPTIHQILLHPLNYPCCTLQPVYEANAIKDYIFLGCNLQLHDYFSFSEEKLIGKTLQELTSKNKNLQLTTPIQQILQSEEDYPLFEDRRNSQTAANGTSG